MEKRRILFVDDNTDILGTYQLLSDFCLGGKADYEIVLIDSYSTARDEIESSAHNIVGIVFDQDLASGPEHTGNQLAALAREHGIRFCRIVGNPDQVAGYEGEGVYTKGTEDMCAGFFEKKLPEWFEVA